MNSLIVAPSTRNPQFIVAALEADVSAYMLGVLDAEKGAWLFREGKQLEACANIVQRRGFFATLKADADAETDAYLSGGNRS